MLERIKQLELERDALASERDKLLIDQKTILDVYTDWLIRNDMILSGGFKVDYVGQFRKAVNKLKKKIGYEKQT